MVFKVLFTDQPISFAVLANGKSSELLGTLTLCPDGSISYRPEEGQQIRGRGETAMKQFFNKQNSLVFEPLPF